MDSTSYQMMSNLKIFSTATLYYFIMNKSLNKLKCFSLSLLFISGIFYTFGNLKSLKNYYIDEKDLDFLINPQLKANIQLDNLKASSTFYAKFRLRDQIYMTEIGLVLIIMYCLISGLSGVYNEYLLKLNFSDSIYLQNIYLYLYGCLFNFFAYLLETHFNVSVNEQSWIFSDFFSGFNDFTWLLIFTQVFNGLTMSIVMKHSNNITRLFVISCSLVVTIVLSVLIFSLKLNIYFYFCFFTILIALYSYIF